MDPAILRAYRLFNQQLALPTLTDPGAVVQSQVAMQAQEYGMSKWAIGLRLATASTDARLEAAFNAGTLLRTHILRPTWHFVAPADLPWLMTLSAPRVHAANAFMYRKLGLDGPMFKRSHDALARALEGGQYQTRDELKAVLERIGIVAEGFHLAYLMMAAELDRVIVSGPRRGKKFTYARFDERTATLPERSRDDAVAELARRYFASRGPASLRDFVWWSGLTAREARIGVEALPAGFSEVSIDGQRCFYLPNERIDAATGHITFLMPDYDEYGISYKDRDALMLPPAEVHLSRPANVVFNRMIVVNGQIVGAWKSAITSKSVEVETHFFTKLTDVQQLAVEVAIRRYQRFFEGSGA